MRTKKELEKRILELEKQVKNYDFMIELIQRQLDNQQPLYPNYPTITIGQDVCEHDYPNPWHSVEPPHCKKCGEQAPKFEITFGNTTGDVMDFNQFGGNMMYTTNSKINSDNSGIK